MCLPAVCLRRVHLPLWVLWPGPLVPFVAVVVCVPFTGASRCSIAGAHASSGRLCLMFRKFSLRATWSLHLLASPCLAQLAPSSHSNRVFPFSTFHLF